MLPENWYDHCVALGNFQPESEFHVSRLDRFWHDARPIAYGASGIHALPRAIERLPSIPEFVEISTYRKRILPCPEGRESKTYQTMRELSFSEACSRPELSFIHPENSSGFLVARPRTFKKSILRQYAAAHHRRDLLDYASLAVELGVLDKKSASELLGAKQFIPGGLQLGIYPRAWLLRALSKIDFVGKEFLYRYADRVRGYDRIQIRAIGFLEERMGSFLLLRHISQDNSVSLPDDVFGYMTTIVDERSSYSPNSAD